MKYAVVIYYFIIMSSVRMHSLLEALVAGFAFGTASIFIRYLSFYGVNSFSIAFYRLIIGSLVLVAIIYSVLRARVVVKVFDKALLNDFRVMVFMALALSLHFIFYIQSVIDTYIINATLLANTAPVMTLIISFFLGVARISKVDVLGVTLGFMGAFIMVIRGLGGGGTFIGDVEALISAFLYAVYVVAGKYISTRDTVSVMCVVYSLSVPVILVYSLVVGVDISFPFSNISALAFIIALGIIPTAIGHTLFISSLKGLRPHETSLVGLLEPVSATIYSLFLFGEVPPFESIIGGMVIALSIYIVSFKGVK